MGRVYAVRDLRQGRDIALKLVEGVDFEALRAEFAVLACLDHPLLARVVDFGRLGDLGFLAMELVPGESPRPGGPASDVASLGAQVAWALAYVHAQGVLHLDVKPANIRVHAGRARLLDFGLAQRLDAAGAAAGTPAYMAPEILTGRGADPRADLYALGATLYHLLAGRPPFIGAGLSEVVEQALFSRPLPLAGAAPGVPGDLAALVDALLARDPAERPATAVQVADALRVLPGVSVPPLPPGHPGCIGRTSEEAALDAARGLVWVRGPAGVGKRYLAERRLHRARLRGDRTGWGAGRGVDALEAALRDAGIAAALPDSDGTGAAGRRARRLEALQAAVASDVVLAVEGADGLEALDVPGLVMGLTEEPGADGLRLEPLREPGVRRFLEGAWPGREVTEAAVRAAVSRTGGLPQRLAWYVADPEGDLDIAGRLRALPAGERRVLQALALLPRAARPFEVAQVAGQPDVQPELVRLVTRGWAAVDSGRRYAPRPEALRERGVESVPDPAMARRAVAIAPSLPARRAAGDAEPLAAALREAATATAELETGRRLLEELFALTGSTEDGLRLEHVLDLQGLREAQARVLDRLPAAEPEVRLRRAAWAMWTGDDTAALAGADRLAAEDGHDSERRARALRVRGLVLQRRGDHAAAAEAFAAARAALPPSGGDPILRAHTVHDLGVSALYLGRHAEALPCFRESLELKRRHGDRAGARIARQNVGICHEALGEPRLALAAYEEALAESRALQTPRGEAWNHMALGGLLRRLGRRQAAARHLASAAAIAESLGQPYLVTGVATEQALLEGTVAALAAAEARVRAAGNGYDADRLGMARVALVLRQGGVVAGPVPGQEAQPARWAALTWVAAHRRGDVLPDLPDGDDPVLALAQAMAAGAAGRPHEMEERLRDALDRTWAVDDRAWLEEALGGAAPTDREDAGLAAQVLDIARELAARRDPVEVAAHVLDAVLAGAGAERALLLRSEGASGAGAGRLRVLAARGPDADSAPSRGIAEAVMRTGEPVRLLDAQAADHLQAERSIEVLGLRSERCVPLRGPAGRSVGCLYADRRDRAGAFGPREVRFVELLADQAAIALETGRLIEATRAQAEQSASVRVVAATNRDLAAMVASGAFRQDLYYRLAAVRIAVPPLRHRPDDIPLLIERFLEGHPIRPDAVHRLTSHDWPGNVRELKNQLERARALAGSDPIDLLHLEELPTGSDRLPLFTSDLKAYVDGIERAVIRDVVDRQGHNLTRAAEVLGLSRFGLRKKMERLGLR